MARKNVLDGLMGPATPKDDNAAPARVNLAKPRYKSGAIGAVSQSIADLKSRSVIEVETDLIDNAGLLDRLDEDSDLDALIDSIRRYGQQVPVLLRPHPEKQGRFEVVYGRRRVSALIRIGQPVKALIRDLDDRDLIMAQGQENNARRDLTFIERANFAIQMRDQGYDRKVICDALHVDKTALSRMLSIADRLPDGLIHAIGAAPSIGRDRWKELADLADRVDWNPSVLVQGDSSDARFESILAELRRAAKPESRPRRLKTRPEIVHGENGEKIAEISRRGRKTVLSFDRAGAAGFDDWLAAHLSEIHRDWKQRAGE